MPMMKIKMNKMRVMMQMILKKYRKKSMMIRMMKMRIVKMKEKKN
jgi:hypothetical protein